jgi:hypothetical protein
MTPEISLEIINPNLSNIPKQLQSLQWAVWKAENEFDDNQEVKFKLNGKPKIKKAPRNLSGVNISKSKPEQWLSFNEVASGFNSSAFSGVGVLMQASNGLVGIDLDDIEDLLVTNQALKHVLEKAKVQGIYCENSPSNTGLRLFIHGKLPNDKGRRKGGIELYSETGFLTVTGNTESLWIGDIKDGQWLIDDMLHLIDPSAHVSQNELILNLPDTELLVDEVLKNKLQQWTMTELPELWAGDWKMATKIDGSDYPSQSEADFALLKKLANKALSATQDTHVIAGTITKVFCASGLFRHEKLRRIKQDVRKITNQIASTQHQIKAKNESTYDLIDFTSKGEMTIDTTDMGNAICLHNYLEGNVKWVDAIKQWMVFSMGKGWTRLSEVEMPRLAEQALRKLGQKGYSSLGPKDLTTITKHVNRSLNAYPLQSAITLLKSRLGVITSVNDLDLDPMLLGLSQGQVLDLRSGFV